MGSQRKRSFLRASWRLLSLRTKSGGREREPEEAKPAERRVVVQEQGVWAGGLRCRAPDVLPRGEISVDLRSHPQTVLSVAEGVCLPEGEEAYDQGRRHREDDQG